jgi:hypothetical protein
MGLASGWSGRDRWIRWRKGHHFNQAVIYSEGLSGLEVHRTDRSGWSRALGINVVQVSCGLFVAYGNTL